MSNYSTFLIAAQPPDSHLTVRTRSSNQKYSPNAYAKNKETPPERGFVFGLMVPSLVLSWLACAHRIELSLDPILRLDITSGGRLDRGVEPVGWNRPEGDAPA